jgi:hypothetical protein
MAIHSPLSSIAVLHKFSYSPVFAKGQTEPEDVPPITNNDSDLLSGKKFTATVGVNDVVLFILTGGFQELEGQQVFFSSPTNEDNKQFQVIVGDMILLANTLIIEYFKLLKEPVSVAERLQLKGLFFDKATGYRFQIKNGHIVKIFSGRGDTFITTSLTYSRNDPHFVKKIHIAAIPYKMTILFSEEGSSISNIHFTCPYSYADWVLFCRVKIY